MLTCFLGEGQYEDNATQIGFPKGVYVLVAMTAHRAWNQLLTKGDLSGNLASIRQAGHDSFQGFVDRPLKAESIILSVKQQIPLLHNCILRMLMWLVPPLDLTKSRHT